MQKKPQKCLILIQQQNFHEICLGLMQNGVDRRPNCINKVVFSIFFCINEDMPLNSLISTYIWTIFNNKFNAWHSYCFTRIKATMAKAITWACLLMRLVWALLPVIGRRVIFNFTLTINELSSKYLFICITTNYNRVQNNIHCNYN